MTPSNLPPGPDLLYQCTVYTHAYWRRLVYVCGVATEFCVRGSVLDALHDGFDVGLVLDCVAAFDEVRGREALLEMEHAGAALLQSSQLAPVRALKLRQQQQQAWAQRWPEDWVGAAEL